MSNRAKQEQEFLRELIHQAVLDEVYSPADVLNYIKDNGWEYTEPTKMTIIKILKENGIEYISGYWEKVK